MSENVLNIDTFALEWGVGGDRERTLNMSF